MVAAVGCEGLVAAARPGPWYAARRSVKCVAVLRSSQDLVTRRAATQTLALR